MLVPAECLWGEQVARVHPPPPPSPAPTALHCKTRACGLAIVRCVNSLHATASCSPRQAIQFCLRWREPVRLLGAFAFCLSENGSSEGGALFRCPIPLPAYGLLGFKCKKYTWTRQLEAHWRSIDRPSRSLLKKPRDLSSGMA